jgi:hypothetical protein
VEKMPCERLEERLEKLAEKLFLVKAKCIDIFCNQPLRKINFFDINTRLCDRVYIWDVAVVNDPVFEGFSVITYRGKYIIFRIDYIIVEMYAILKPLGEPVIEGLEDRLRQLEIK